jgi:hypothetical protein
LGVRSLVGLALVVAYLELFRALDWGYGILRAILVVGLAALALVLLIRTRAGERQGLAPVLLLPAAGLALALNLYASIKVVVRTVEAQEIEMDQGQNSFRALEYLRKGANPYATTAVLDPYTYLDLESHVRLQPSCLARPDVPNPMAALASYWQNVDPKATSKLLPILNDTVACGSLAREAASLGYKYGPVLLLTYFPFVLAFGKPGIFVAHIVLVVLATLLLAWFARARGSSWATTAGAVFLLLAPSHLRENVLHLSASDLAPTLAATAALVFLVRGRDGWAAFLIGLSVACKVLPGLIYAPLLLACRRRQWSLFLLPIAVSFAPFLVWDSRGFVNNIVLFNLGRPTDSTALAHFVSQPVLLALELAGLAALLVTLGWARKQHWSAPSILAYLWVGHAAVLVGGAIFHNNYLIWLLPLLGLTFLFVVDGAHGRANQHGEEASA